MSAETGYQSSSGRTSWPSQRPPESEYTAARGHASRVPSTLPPPPAYTESPMNPTSMLDDIALESLGQTPTVDHCVVHLALMDAFARLREDVSSRDGLFGISDELAELARLLPSEQASALERLDQIREKRWAVYVCRAVDRFERWWGRSLDKIPNAESRGRLRQRDLAYKSGFEVFTRLDISERLHVTPDELPPLDVLMVWHAFMLDPRDYLEDCLRYGRMGFWATGMPWAAIHSSMDGVHLRSEPGLEAQDFFKSTTGLAWDNVDDAMEKTIACPACPWTSIKCEWTTCTLMQVRSQPPVYHYITPRPSIRALEVFFRSGIGYADPDFRKRCTSCRTVITHDTLRVEKFRLDVEKLFHHDYPMPGTVLKINGRPGKATQWLSLKRMPMLFPNRLLLVGLGGSVVELVAPSPNGNAAKVNDIKTLIEQRIKSRSLVRAARSAFVTSTLGRPEQAALRRMMSCYWDNSSPFALDLVGAVTRQSAFVQKMREIDWLRSLALRSTMQNLLIKYKRYFAAMALSQDHVPVPTFDVDLGWQTHLLSPRTYYKYSIERSGRLIDHDDKVSRVGLSDAFERDIEVVREAPGGLLQVHLQRLRR